MTARAELTAASFRTCSRELAKGQVKRCMQRGPLVGYYIACPGCGFIATYLHEDVGYVETPTDPLTYPKKLIKIERPPKCYSCKRSISVVIDGDAIFLEAA